MILRGDVLELSQEDVGRDTAWILLGVPAPSNQVVFRGERDGDEQAFLALP